jgi:hypothetical protein
MMSLLGPAECRITLPSRLQDVCHPKKPAFAAVIGQRAIHRRQNTPRNRKILQMVADMTRPC